MKLQTFTIPTNPDYDFTSAPESQHEYANPVTLNNKLVQLANAYLDITSVITKGLKHRADLKQQLEASQEILEDMELDILDKVPPTATSDTKTTRTIQAYIIRQLRETGLLEAYDAEKAHLRNLKQQQIQQDMQLEAARAVLNALELQSNMIQTHLSFVKNEARNARHYT